MDDADQVKADLFGDHGGSGIAAGAANITKNVVIA